eukprot:6915285-Prorocentrum_lima.AAC.1
MVTAKRAVRSLMTKRMLKVLCSLGQAARWAAKKLRTWGRGDQAAATDSLPARARRPHNPLAAA